MSSTKYAWATSAVLAGLLIGAQIAPATALADPPVEPAVDPAAPPQVEGQTGPLHNVTYRARIDGVSRNATIAYKIDDSNVNTADPTMLPGRTFEATGVVTDPQLAGMTVRIDWPYSANLHCEILVDDQVIAQADTFVAPRLTRPKNDPGYGSLLCGANLADGTGNVINTGPVEPVEPVAPAEPPPPPPAQNAA
ncbi:hypothetical protein [Mycolicibacterium smegmatis]|jgi:hypothetical protein|uniref:Uncharacterized protein n=2 Tax=Mycolicibacterium smegmatis TaxID=1772 RepID=I7G3N6_MYCS2|nr:hypothetical protein [Mycolicibacterium smegmatis]AFP40187.1 hypothetical protein MSMEI_3729 [Mycolicibacterium smegmatis MC2 155]AWT54775.1 hypothetical protein D806_038090 [Mycolicibacterium smegmatis MKD8]MCC3338884.1 hypothetical protein [Mycolicibacterium smegmatis]MCO4193619.1 hypothetical protein [Mycolicibacterium smegmatis]MCP2621538.1 hypothetical protein [Mycolicibacterium smegmatis]